MIERLNITSGDALELSSIGKKTTVLSWPARNSDRGKGLIRIDGYTRNKLDVGINDQIEVKKVESKDAKSITFAPTEPLRIVGAEEYLAEYLNGQANVKRGHDTSQCYGAESGPCSNFYQSFRSGNSE